MGIGLLANNIIAVAVVLVHYIPYIMWMRTIDKELIRMFGTEFKKYQKEVPPLLPKYGNWKKFIKIVFS
jgi:protein-S-isoprenylcysteine O-methyltransferase Ste14